MSAPAEQWVHHQVPVSKFHLEQFKHVAGNQVFELQCHNSLTTINAI